VAVAAFAAAALFPRALGELPQLPRAETWISAACGGAQPCARWVAVQQLAAVLEERMPGVAEEERYRLSTAIAEESEEARLDPLFVLALIKVESGFDQDAVSQRGAQGLMQLKPSTLRGEAERSDLDLDDPTDAVVNVRAGVRYYRRLLDAFRQNHELALMAYNAGPQRISRMIREEGGVPDRYRGYARRVHAELRRLRGDGRARVASAAEAAPAAGMR
jgi:soluble lytic murein transglycosylase-like protein